MQLKWVNHRKNETLTCALCAAYSILTIGARYSFLGTELGAAAASHRALTPVHSVWADMEDEGMHDPHLILSAATILDTLYFASTHGRFDKSKV